MTIISDTGRAYTMTQTAAIALANATTAPEADRAFDAYADHIPERSRCDAWLAADTAIRNRLGLTT